MRSPIVQLTLARLREWYREPETIFWTFLFPPLLAVALGIAFRNQGPAPARVLVLDGPQAQATADALGKNELLKVEVAGREAADRMLASGRAEVLVVPGSPVTYRFDPSRSESHLARAHTDQALQSAAGRADPVPVRDEPVQQAGSRYIDFLIPGLLGLNLMSAGLWGIGWSIVDARTRKLLRRLLAAPMRRRDFLFAQIAARMFYLPFEVIFLLGMAWLLFDVTIVGSILGVTLIVLLGALSFAGLGTLLASRAKTTEGINGLINLFNLPMFLLSGVFFSSSRFPDFLQPFIRALPLTALNDALRAVINQGQSVWTLGPQFAVLAVWGVMSFLLALKLFRWST